MTRALLPPLPRHRWHRWLVAQPACAWRWSYLGLEICDFKTFFQLVLHPALKHWIGASDLTGSGVDQHHTSDNNGRKKRCLLALIIIVGVSPGIKWEEQLGRFIPPGIFSSSNNMGLLALVRPSHSKEEGFSPVEDGVCRTLCGRRRESDPTDPKVTTQRRTSISRVTSLSTSHIACRSTSARLGVDLVLCWH